MQPTKPPRLSRNKNMDPMDDIKKLGEILMKRTSEKEYYRFLHIQEQCRMKWIANNDKFSQLKREHEKCKAVRNELETKLRHVTQMLLNEKQICRNAELERDFFLKKLKQAYEYLRSPIAEDNPNDRKSNNKYVQNDAQTNDEITSTGSFLSNLSDMSVTDDDILETSTLGFNATSNNITYNIAKDMTQNNNGLSIDKSWFEKTLQAKHSRDIISENADDTEIEFESSSEVLSPSKRPKKYLHVAENFSIAKLSDGHSKRSFEIISSDEISSNPIYERIKGSESSFELDDKENNGNYRNIDTPETIVEHIEIPICKVDSKTEIAINPRNCQHTFSHRTALRSDVCFLCSKKFRFGILAFRCTSCKVFVHHDCKSQLKTSLKSRQLGKGGVQNHCISDYVPEVGPSVPALIVHCVNEVETRGLSERGIYRVSGSEKEIKALKDRFLYDEHLPNLSNVDMHVICGCIKVFLRSLREPLIPTPKWVVFSNAVVNFDGDYLDGNILRSLQLEISQLPKANRDTLAFLVLHLQRVATCDAVKMPISNLAKIFGPTVIGYSKSEPDHAEILGETMIQQNVMQHFLNISTDYWFSFINKDISL